MCVLDWWCAAVYRYLPLLLDGGVGAVDIFFDTLRCDGVQRVRSIFSGDW